MSEELPRSKGDALLDRLMQLRMLYEKEHEVYEAAMALWQEWEDGADLTVEAFSDDATATVDRFDAACRRAKEGR